MSEALFLARIAGLPAGVLEPFSHPELSDEIAALRRLDIDCRAERASLVERLHAAIHGAERGVRRALLGAKRDAYNQRPIRLAESDSAWNHCPEGLSIARRIASLETEVARLETTLLHRVAAARQVERRHLVRQLDDPSFGRAVALSSPEFFRAVDRLRRRPTGARDRKTRRLETTLLRFVSRAASKLSPYSTFTALGLGRTVPASIGPRHSGSAESTRSVLRLKRYLVDRALALAISNPRIRAPLTTRLNATARSVGVDRVRLLCPGRWQLDDEAREFRYLRDRFVTLGLDGVWLDRLRELTRPGPPWRDVVRQLALELEGDDASATLGETERLLQPWLDSGLLVLEWPWPSQTSHLEAHIAEALGAQDDAAELHDLGRALDDVATWQLAWPDADDPLPVLAGLDAAIAEWTRRAAQIGGVDPDTLDSTPPVKGNYYEDVFVADRSAPADWDDRADTAEAGTVFEISRASAEKLFATLDPIVRLSYLYNPRHDVLASLAHRIDELWPGGDPVPLLDVFHAVQPLWQAATRHQRDTRGALGGLSDTFDPFGLGGIAQLADFKRRLWDDRDGWVVRRGDELEINADRLTEHLDTLPSGYRPAVGPCLLLQAADAVGERWVLNRLYEGVGRYASRFTAVMDEPERQRYTEHFRQRSAVQIDGKIGGEAVDLLDIVRPQGDILNVHAVQTRFVLDHPGERSAVPDDRRRTLDQLFLRVDRSTERFGGLATVHVVDHEGRRFLPTHLGSAGPYVMSSLIKFLIVLGVGEILPIYPERPARRVGDVAIRDRLVLGPIVLQRRRWIVPDDDVPRALFAQPEDRAFVEFQRWRLARGLPDRFYLQESISHFALPDRFKPQWIDARSPSCVSLLAAHVQRARGALVIEEALPDLDAFPVDRRGQRRAVELQIDALSMAAATVDRSVACRS